MITPLATAPASHDINVWLGLLQNGVLAWGLAACGVAQLSKLAVELVVHGRWRPGVLFETGGMPSSHSALMTGTTAAIGWQQGFADPLFALAAALAFIVIYDAAGVRRAAGLTAVRVNELPAGLWQAETAQPPALTPLKENLGHTRLEALAGSLMGPAVALPGLALVGTPLQLVDALRHVLG